MSEIVTREFILTEPDRREILRYAGVRDDGKRYQDLISELLEKARAELKPKACYMMLNLTVKGNTVDFGVFSVDSRSLAERLRGCTQAYIFAATVGVGIDRLISRCGALSQTAQLVMESVGAERVECLCDLVCEQMSRETEIIGASCVARFSPGYGDLPLGLQSEIIRLLDTGRKIGVVLNDSLLLTPTKSVTAIVGVKPKDACM